MMLKILTHPLRSVAWTLVNAWVNRSFPNAPAMTTQELAALMENGDDFSPIVIDARKNEEFEVSHLPNAYHARDVATVAKLGIAPDQPIVVYCSIGYRSARLVEKLREAGFSAAKNLEGSIFQWANEGRPLMQDGQLVGAVHPYSATWGLLLERNTQSHHGPCHSS
jgi:rhodanese-related sulfurtransferase